MNVKVNSGFPNMRQPKMALAALGNNKQRQQRPPSSQKVIKHQMANIHPASRAGQPKLRLMQEAY